MDNQTTENVKTKFCKEVNYEQLFELFIQRIKDLL